MTAPANGSHAKVDGRAISIVVPFHNEAANLIRLVTELAAALRGGRYELLFVDDRSTDDGVDLLSSLAAHDGRIRILRLGVRSGKAAALAAGFREARGDIIVTMDGDRQDDPANISRMIAHLDAGFDVVSGWKVPRRDPLRRRVASKLFNLAVRRVSGLGLHDVNCGMKVYTAGAVAAIVEDCVGDMHRFLPMFAHARGYRVGELQISHRPRGHGRSNYGVRRYLHGLLDLSVALVVARFSQRPMHVLGGAGLGACAFAGGAFAWYALTPDSGWMLPLAGLALLLLAAQFFLAGVITEAIAHRHRWPIAYSTVLTLPAADETPRIHAPLSIVRAVVEAPTDQV